MNFRQKRSIYKTTLAFGPDRLEYTFSAFNNRQGGSVPYERIPSDWKTICRKNWRAKYFSIAFMAFGTVGGFAVMSESTPHARDGGLTFMATCFVAAAALYILERVFRPDTDFTVIPLKPEIRILHDEQAEAIAAEIRQRRRDALRRKMLTPDPLNSAAAESNKFRWLHEEDIVSDEEYAQAMATLSGGRDDDRPADIRPESNRKLH
jgi:hypothetical protein